MKSNTNHQEIETIQQAKQLLLDYYIEITKEIKDYSTINEEMVNISLNDIINKIKESVNNIQESSKIKCTSNETEERIKYEPIIQKLEAEIRNHYKIESQLRLYNTLLEEKLNSFAIKQQQHQTAMPMRTKEITDNNSGLLNYYIDDRRDEEILIIKAENSNLKAKLSQYETLIQIGDQKEKEMIEEFEKEREELLKEISLSKSKLSKQKNNKSVYSTSNYNINIGNIYSTNIISKNNSNGKNKLIDTKEIRKFNEVSIIS